MKKKIYQVILVDKQVITLKIRVIVKLLLEDKMKGILIIRRVKIQPVGLYNQIVEC